MGTIDPRTSWTWGRPSLSVGTRGGPRRSSPRRIRAAGRTTTSSVPPLLRAKLRGATPTVRGKLRLATTGRTLRSCRQNARHRRSDPSGRHQGSARSRGSDQSVRARRGARTVPIREVRRTVEIVRPDRIGRSVRMRAIARNARGPRRGPSERSDRAGRSGPSARTDLSAPRHASTRTHVNHGTGLSARIVLTERAERIDRLVGAPRTPRTVVRPIDRVAARAVRGATTTDGAVAGPTHPPLRPPTTPVICAARTARIVSALPRSTRTSRAMSSIG